MITFKATVSPRRKADGTYPVKIRVTFKRKSRYLATNITVTDADLTRTRKIKNSGVLAATNKLCEELREVAGRLSPFTVETWDVDRAVRWIRAEQRREHFELDFIAYGYKVAERQSKAIGRQTQTALRALSRYTAGACDVNDITTGFLQGFIDFVEGENKWPGGKPSKVRKLPGVTAKAHFSRLAAVFKAARMEFNDEDAGVTRIPRDPFPRMTVKDGVHVGQRNLGKDLMQVIILDKPTPRAQRRALDAFVVSFALMGANVSDLWDAPPPAGDVWKYERKKTRGRRRDRAYMEVKIPACLEPYLKRLRDPSGKRWLKLPGKNTGACCKLLNRGLKLWCEASGVEPFTMYAARHSWASIARSKDVGIEKATVDDCLNHVSMALADIYIAKDYDVFAEANSKVLALFDWEKEKI